MVLALAAGSARAADRPPIAARSGMVVSAQALASRAGLQVLQEGGNAVDAAVAVGYALAVVYPAGGNLGGGGFMLLHLADGRTTFLDFREKAPLAASKDMFLDAAGEVVQGRSTKTWLGVGVPGSAAGLEAARARYGTLPRAAVMAPAIRLAREGFVLTPGDVALFSQATDDFRRDPAAAAIFLPGGRPLTPGDRLVQPDLARTLERLAADGPEAMYRGPIGDAIVAASQAGGGILQRPDFASYKVRELEPVGCTYRGYQIVSAPPPSSGGTVMCEILNILEGYDLNGMGFHSAAEVHVLVEAMRHAYLDRNTLGDPDFTSNPVAHLLDKDYAAAIRGQIDPVRATPSASLQQGTAPHEGDHTTHFSVMDRQGNAVGVTYSLNSWFGMRGVAAGTGILMNDTMDDFTAKPGTPNMFGLVQGAANAIAPGKTPLSSMSPTMVLKDGKPVMVTGSDGGSRIITVVLEAILNVIDHGMTIQEAIDAPRIHHQWIPDTVYLERFALSPDTAGAARSARLPLHRERGLLPRREYPGRRAAPLPRRAGRTCNRWTSGWPNCQARCCSARMTREARWAPQWGIDRSIATSGQFRLQVREREQTPMSVAMAQQSAMDSAVRYLVTKYNPQGNRVGWLMMSSILVEAWDLYSIAFVLVFIKEQFNPDPLLLGLAGAGTQGGALIGALLGGWLSDKIGRRVMFLATMILFIILAVAQAFVPNVMWLVVVRLFLGIPLGSDISNGYTYIMESMPKGMREVMGNRWPIHVRHRRGDDAGGDRDLHRDRHEP